MDSRTYLCTLKRIGAEVGIENLSEHSARRGGIGYEYFVLRRDIFFLFFYEVLKSS